MVLLLLTALAGAPTPAAGQDSVTIARLRYGGGGDWYVSPSAIPNLLAEIRARTGIPVAAREAQVAPLDPALPDHPFLYMSGHGQVTFTAAEAAALRQHLLGGGFLLVNDSYGLDESFREAVAAVFPDRPLAEVPRDHPVFHLFYDFPDGPPKIHEHDGNPPRALGIFHEGRLVVLYLHESDIGDGWEDPDVHDDPPEVREQAIRMGVNIFLYALSAPAT
ncbi:MAG: DUF4159 domain-containing protein [Longimicrobiales bacterium]|nr:DUF4159 domain-containing protein [Longimicrobiales bacterium]